MKFSSAHRLLLGLCVVAIISACSNKRDGTAYRLYHNMTAHYNGYFNADELVAKGVTKIEAAEKNDYDKILPIFIYGDEETAKASYPDMEKAIEKCEKVISKHTIKDESKKTKKRPEYNKWIDENYMVVGRAYFYKKNYAKATDIFQYVNRKFKKPETTVSTNSWLARTYIAKEEYGKAIQSLTRAENEATDEKVSDELKAEYHLVFADALIHQKKIAKAAEELELALQYISPKRNRARPHFILAQIYQQLDRSSDALTEYQAVIISRPVYELEFHARINKALSYSRVGGSSADIQKQLFKMLKDEKNLDYRDQIYYALGDIAWEEQRRDAAIDYYEKSIAFNKENPKQKAKAFLRLADLYFDERRYGSAQLYYDSTLTTITAEHERYAIVKARAESLTELVASLDAIALNDSLTQICKLSPKERERKLADIQKNIEAAKQEQQRQDLIAEEKAKAAASALPEGITGTFWPYNESLRQKGKTNFLEYWGERPLKDNWRLQSKLSQSFGPGEESGTPTSENSDGSNTDTATQTDKYAAPTVEELSSGLPCDDPTKMEQMHTNAAEGYYNAGVIYKEKLDDDDNAISTWEELLANLDSSEFHPTTYYQLFRTWLAKETTKGYVRNPMCSDCNSKYWGDEIKSRYPGSDWAMLVENPGYLDIQDMKNTKEEEAYQIVYSTYTGRQYAEAKAICDSVITNEPLNHLLCKYKLLSAVCTGYTEVAYGNLSNYLNQLDAINKSCPGTEEATRAQELLKAANKSNTTSNELEIKTDESTGEKEQENIVDSVENLPPPVEEIESVFKYDGNAEHYFAIIIPVKNSDITKSKIDVADFNTNFYASSQLKVSNNLLNKDFHLILVKSFKKMEEANNYVAAFIGDQVKLKEFNAGGYRSFLISKQNYISLFKNKDVDQYMDFYVNYYK